MVGNVAAGENAVRWTKLALWGAILLSAGSLLKGLLTESIFSQPIWQPRGLELLIGVGAVYFGLAATAYLTRPAAFPSLFFLLSLTFAAMSVGVGAIAATAATLLAASLVGDAILGPSLRRPGGATRTVICLALGIGVYGAAIGLLVYLPVNYAVVYWSLIAAPIYFYRRRIRHLLRGWQWMAKIFTAPDVGAYASASAFGFLLLCHFLVALKPEVSHDGLLMHLYIPGYVAAAHRWPFDTGQVVYAAVPMIVDWLYTLLFALGGESACRLLNFSALAALSILLVRFAANWLSVGVALMLGTAFLSSPVVQLVTGSMFVDNFLALWILAAFLIFVGADSGRGLLAGAITLGICLQSKLGAVVAVVLIGGLAAAGVYRRRDKGWSWIARCAIGLVVVVLIGMPPYLTAWWRTGNPIYPFMNPYFQATQTPFTVVPPFHDPLRWSVLYDLSFRSSTYLESQNGAFGLHFMLFIALGACGLLLSRGKHRTAYVIGAGIFVITYLGSSNIRYLYPALSFFTVAAAAPLAAVRSVSAVLWRLALGLIGLLTCVNLYLLPASGWYHRQFFLPDIVGGNFRSEYAAAFRPTQPVTEYLNLAAPGAAVAYLGTNQIAGLHGTAYTLTWHHTAFEERIRLSKTVAQVGIAMRDFGIEWFVSSENPVNLSEPLQRFLADYTERGFSRNGMEARRTKAIILSATELLGNREFDEGIKGWSMYGSVKLLNGTAYVSSTNTLSQSFVATPRERFRYVLVARCALPGTVLRLQVNWIAASGVMSGLDLQPVECSKTERTYTLDVTAPASTALGVVIVGGHGPEPVAVERVSLLKIGF